MKKSILFLVAIAFMAFSANAQIFSDDFQDGDFSNWTTVAPTYGTNPYTWHITSYPVDVEYYLTAACYDGTNNLATEQWVISPAFNAAGVSNLNITFDNRGRYLPLQPLEVYVSTDFAGDSLSFDAATWTQVTGFTWDESYDNYDWVEATTSTASIAGTANTYLAFKYVSQDGGDGFGGNWVVDNVIVDGTANVNEINNTISVYPNPATDYITIKNAEKFSSLEIVNIAGQKVYSSNNTTSVDVSNFQNGVYFIILDGTVSTKFVK